MLPRCSLPLLALLFSCGQPGADVGIDARVAGADATAGRDAAAGAAVEAPCEGYSAHTDYPDGRRFTNTRYQARVDVGDPLRFPRFRALVCGLEVEGPPAGCPSGATCSGAEPPLSDCYFTTGGAVHEGRLLIDCGWAQENRDAAGTVTRVGNRYTTVRVMVDP